MPLPIVVDMYAPQPRPQELAALIAACSRAAAPSECVSSDAKSSEAPLGVAIVRREGDRARIELGLRGAADPQWSTRDLVFQPGDDELERYRAIGFAIGTLVARQIEPPAPPEPEPAPAPAPVARPEPPVPSPPTPVRAPRGTWLDATGSVGLGLIPGPPRVGGALRVSSELVPRSFFAVVEGGYAVRLGEPSLGARWLTLSAGLGHPLAPNVPSLGVDVRLLISVERLSVTAFAGDDSEGHSAWKPGVTAAIDGHWDVAPPLGLVLSVATLIDPERTVFRSRGQIVGETPALGLSGYLGVRLKLR